MGDMEGKSKQSKKINHFRELEVYQKAFKVAMKIFEITKNFPPEERYSLTDQIRRSSRSVCSNLAEGWRKRRYPAVFKNKLTDSQFHKKFMGNWMGRFRIWLASV